MSYGNDGKHPGCDQSYFGRREFSFTLENDIYMCDFSPSTMAMNSKRPLRRNSLSKSISDQFTAWIPAKRHAYAQSGDNIFTPVERELIFDIDISDYDDVRFCCSGADVCSECCPLMTVAIKVIDTALRDDFGFNHILWVYSGRRGVHCWVCDGKARRLNNEQRAVITEYLHVHKGSENSHKKVTLSSQSLHPFPGRSYAEVLKDFFEEKFIHCQNLFSSEERYAKILEMIPDELLLSYGESDRITNGHVMISMLFDGVTLSICCNQGNRSLQSVRRCVEEIVFTFTYPRLDLEVSKHMSHLLKAPFCIHPKTGLLEELNMGALRTGGEEELENTSLGKSIRYFRSSFLQPLLKSCK
ncbi:hypothetical protein OROGR_007517 [Orobanche gracilis]